MEKELQAQKKQFVEDVGILFEHTNLPRMAGRILGCLLICEPSYQSMEELTSTLSASKGSISTSTRLLIRIGLIERFWLPGVRHCYFRLKPIALNQSLKQSVEQFTSIRQLAERGLKLLDNKNSSSREWLKEMHDMHAFFEREFPSLLEQWEQESKGKNKTAGRVNHM